MQLNYFVIVWKPLFHINFTCKTYYDYTILHLSLFSLCTRTIPELSKFSLCAEHIHVSLIKSVQTVVQIRLRRCTELSMFSLNYLDHPNMRINIQVHYKSYFTTQYFKSFFTFLLYIMVLELQYVLLNVHAILFL